MSYRVTCTRPDGSVFQTTDEPPTTKTEAGLSVLHAMGNEDSHLTIGEAERVGTRVRDTPTGETTLHEPTGYRFRTEEF